MFLLVVLPCSLHKPCPVVRWLLPHSSVLLSLINLCICVAPTGICQDFHFDISNLYDFFPSISKDQTCVLAGLRICEGCHLMLIRRAELHLEKNVVVSHLRVMPYRLTTPSQCSPTPLFTSLTFQALPGIMACLNFRGVPSGWTSSPFPS